MDTSVEEVFFSLLRTSLWGKERFPIEMQPETDWEAVRTELKYHAIQHLPVDLLVKYDPVKRQQYLQNAFRAFSHWQKLMKVQQSICQVLLDAQIPCAVIKGASADQYYPQPANRSMGDIDLLVSRKDLEAAMVLLLENGCTLHDDRNPRHIELKKNGIAIEIHRHFAALSDTDRATYVDNCLIDSVPRGQMVTVDGFMFPTLPKKENGLALLEHINLHLESGLGFRQIIDWMLYASRELDDDFWFSEFRFLAQKAGLERLAITVTRMCQVYLGLTDAITWCYGADPALCQNLLIHTMQQGNFGKKTNAQLRKTVGVLGILDSDLNFFQLLQKNGCYNWKLLRRHPWLKPFAWLYQLCRYLRASIFNWNWIRNFFTAFRKKKQATDLLDQIGVQRVNHALEHPEQ